MDLVSRKKELGHSYIIMTTQGSLLEMSVAGPRESRPLQLSIARPKRLAGGQSRSDVTTLKGTLGNLQCNCSLDGTLDMAEVSCRC